MYGIAACQVIDEPDQIVTRDVSDGDTIVLTEPQLGVRGQPFFVFSVAVPRLSLLFGFLLDVEG